MGEVDGNNNGNGTERRGAVTSGASLQFTLSQQLGAARFGRTRGIVVWSDAWSARTGVRDDAADARRRLPGIRRQHMFRPSLSRPSP